MPCPLPLASSQNASSESKWPRVSFSSHRTSVREGIHPLHKTIGRNSPPLAQPHPRNMLCARQRAFNPIHASCISARCLLR
jgi:hypothetical protein